MKLHERTFARVVDPRNRSAYGLLSRAGRLGTARLGFRQRGASPWRESRLSTNVQTELCFPALSCLLRRFSIKYTGAQLATQPLSLSRDFLRLSLSQELSITAVSLALSCANLHLFPQLLASKWSQRVSTGAVSEAGSD
ncbi:unnamed protein product [Nesidiocoris tenuis]|uniref:Uncharacterized protein n=1 Tax=Nesidiocoris tenuis TaxID=355587 RepID=A0A6H5GH36_9HEMI|nr:unnamed protein product [Nesidiocoris tenuis]CAB0002906.1 unnamed protein product [Nesidiocoris tenuis]